MPPDDAEPLAEELVGRMAAYDEALARGDAAPGLTPLPPALEARWPRLQSCLHLLHQVGPGLGVYADGVPAAGWHPGGLPQHFGRFVIRRELGRGGFGIVFLADDPHLRRPVALKVPRPDVLANADLRQRFLREARAAAKLDHPHVVPVHEVGNVGPVYYIVCAYCPGDNLAVWLRRQPGPVPPPAAAALVAALATAVEHAHGHGVFHRDLKPSNILLMPRPEATTAAGDLAAFLPKLTDFGLAKLLEADSEQTTTGVVLGTPVYMAPEQAEGWGDVVGAPTDVYALGVILYELLTRCLPCQGASLLLTLEQVRSGQPVPPRHWQPGVPRDLETICLKCLEKEPGQRYATAANLAEDLQSFLHAEPIAARPAGLLARARSWCRRPERIRDAALVAAFNGFIRTVGNGTGLVLALCGAFAVARWGPALAFFLGDFILGCAVLYISWHTGAHHRGTLWAGLIVPLVWPPILIAGVAGQLDMGGLSNDSDPSAEMAQAAFILLRDVAMFVSYALALVAYYANRHRPGFVPALPPPRSAAPPERHS